MSDRPDLKAMICEELVKAGRPDLADGVETVTLVPHVSPSTCFAHSWDIHVLGCSPPGRRPTDDWPSAMAMAYAIWSVGRRIGLPQVQFRQVAFLDGLILGDAWLN